MNKGLAGSTAAGRRFLFLQGPPGPFFRLLGAELARRGAEVFRINLSGGDRYDWREGATDFRRRSKHWPLFFDSMVQDRAITDVVLFGDCRPVHRVAVGLAQLRGVHVHVYEEGYIRPDWMTLERDGVNGHSSFERDPEVILAAARWLPPVPALPSITAQFSRRARDSYWYFHHAITGRWRFPFYRGHRANGILEEGLGWAFRFARVQRRARQAEATLGEVADQRYFLFPLQLSGDYQIRAHSPFGTMLLALDYVLASFARHAPADCVLLVKEHPLDPTWMNWRRVIHRRAQRMGLANRILHIDGGELQPMAENAIGMVCVNSTSGTLALEVGTPVIVLGDAVYDVPGATYQGLLDDFWSNPGKPDRELYQAFKRLLHAQCLVRGGLASESAIQILIDSSIARLLARDEPGPRARTVPTPGTALGTAARVQAPGTSPASSR
jgi:capsular polysaccharide export protein